MRRSFCCVLLLIVIFFQYVISCKNFTVQHCIDTPTGLKSISTTRCIQLVPAQYNLSIDYSVKNYIIKKSTTCYNIVSLDSPSINLFSNTCQELCPEEYCKLFDNQSSTSIINIFYSSSSTYEIITSLTYDVLSYDYLLFDSCSSDNKLNKYLLIVVYILSAIIVILTIVVILKFILARRLEKGRNERPYEPYNLSWVFDCLFCHIHEKEKSSEGKPNSTEETISQPRSNQLHRRDFDSPSTPTHVPIHDNSNSTNNQVNVSSNNTSDNQDYHYFSSAYNTPNPVRRNNIESADTETDSEINESENRHRLPNPASLRQKLSQEMAAALTTNSSTSKYELLEKKITPNIIHFRV